MDVSVESILDVANAELGKLKNFGILLFWLRVEVDRDEVCHAIEASLGQGSSIVPIVLRKPLFRDPNSLAMDLSALINDNRVAIDPCGDRIAEGDSLAIVLIAKTALEVAQSSSPARLPEWFPRYGGLEVTAFVRDLASVAGASLKSKEARLDDLSSQLFNIERAACSRAGDLLASNKHHGQPLWNSLLKERSGVISRQAFIGEWKKSLDKVADPYGYRPTLKEKCSLIGALWSIFVDVPPSKLGSFGESLRDFLGLDSATTIEGLEPLFPILFRGVNDSSLTSGAKLGRALIVVVGSSCQLTTAGAHSDQYGRVMASLLSSMSIDFRRYLSSFEKLLSERPTELA